MIPVKRLGPDGLFGWYRGDHQMTAEEVTAYRAELADLMSRTEDNEELQVAGMLWHQVEGDDDGH